ncbi:hypothetical protein H9N25_12925 [Pedobacter riviphilus]|uniref:Uncharacterized protein n=1 Tax=Pedobacter riviphilus TaxID=2766984 RepID=A0ABX6TBM0_9SPHI|nr:hypothetical protein H9N25_12925 [Pedobacter riviphilus]
MASPKQKPKSFLKKNVKEININTVVNGARFVDSKNLYDSVVYVPLKTTRNNLIGKIDQLGITDKYFIILGQASKSISIYLKDGKFSACFISHLPAAYILKSYQQIAKTEKLPPFTVQSRSLFEGIRSLDNPVLVKLYPKKFIFPKNFSAKGI